VEHDPECDTLLDPDGIGEVQISATMLDEQVTGDVLLGLAADHIDEGADIEEVEIGEFSGITLDYEADNAYWQEWYLMAESLILFVTYVCDLEHEGKIEDVVELILDSLRVNKAEAIL
jgi:hypothetical protein